MFVDLILFVLFLHNLFIIDFYIKCLYYGCNTDDLLMNAQLNIFLKIIITRLTSKNEKYDFFSKTFLMFLDFLSA